MAVVEGFTILSTNYHVVSNRYSIAEAVAIVSKDSSSEKDLGKVVRTTEETESGLEGKVTEVQAGDKRPVINTAYSLEREEFQAYGQNSSAPLDYEKLFAGEKSVTQKREEEEYHSSKTSEVQSEMLTPAEAKQVFTEMQYAWVLGAASDVNFQERRKFDLWIKFNPAFFRSFESQSVTRDVNYGAY